MAEAAQLVEMITPKVLIIRTPGTSGDCEISTAFQNAGANVKTAHINEFLNNGLKMADYQVLVFPGGFSYGDSLGAGKIMGNEIRIKLGNEITQFTAEGGLILGIGNGFQVLTRAGILPGNDANVTFTRNDSGHFECRWTHLAVNPHCECVFTNGIEQLYLPSAHEQGKLAGDEDSLNNLHVVLNYTDSSGRQPAGYPDNPSGSLRGIAGICDETGRILGMMPHPERYIYNYQHPGWAMGLNDNSCDGFKIFSNAVDWVKHL